MRLRDGDIVVAYVSGALFDLLICLHSIPSLQTDGFSDNVFPIEMLRICKLLSRSGGPEEEMVQAMADRMVEYSRKCMFNKTRVSPFESASKAYPSSIC